MRGRRRGRRCTRTRATGRPRDARRARHRRGGARAARAAPGIELSFSTGLWITGGDVDVRDAAISDWTVAPDLVSLNLSEDGWRELADADRARDRDRGGRMDAPRRRDLLAESGDPGAARARRAALGEPPTRRSRSPPRSTPRWTRRRPRAAAASRRGRATWAVARRGRAARPRDPDRPGGRAHAARRAPRARQRGARRRRRCCATA